MFDILIRYIDEHKMLLHKKQIITTGKKNLVSNMKIPSYQNQKKKKTETENKGRYKQQQHIFEAGFLVAFT